MLSVPYMISIHILLYFLLGTFVCLGKKKNECKQNVVLIVQSLANSGELKEYI